MSITDAIRNFQRDQGWTDETLLLVLMDFLEEQRGSYADLMNYLEKRANPDG